MDPLTKRLMVQSGLRPGNPMLPPVQGMRMVYLKEEMTDAEDDLHKARLALEKYEKNSSNTNRNNLYRAMAKLMAKEQDYFASRYIGRKNTGVLKGWHNEKKQQLLYEKISDMYTKATGQVTRIAGRPYSTTALPKYANEALTAARLFRQATIIIRKMDSAWYTTIARENRYENKPTTIPGWLIDVNNKVNLIRAELHTVLTLPDTDTKKGPSLYEIRKSLQDAEICERIAILIDNNRWDLPMDLR